MAVVAAGHRVVHGGTRFAAPVRLTPELLQELEALVSLAPLQQRHNLTPIKSFVAHLGRGRLEELMIARHTLAAAAAE